MTLADYLQYLYRGASVKKVSYKRYDTTERDDNDKSKSERTLQVNVRNININSSISDEAAKKAGYNSVEAFICNIPDEVNLYLRVKDGDDIQELIKKEIYRIWGLEVYPKCGDKFIYTILS